MADQRPSSASSSAVPIVGVQGVANARRIPRLWMLGGALQGRRLCRCAVELRAGCDAYFVFCATWSLTYSQCFKPAASSACRRACVGEKGLKRVIFAPCILAPGRGRRTRARRRSARRRRSSRRRAGRAARSPARREGHLYSLYRHFYKSRCSVPRHPSTSTHSEPAPPINTLLI